MDSALVGRYVGAMENNYAPPNDPLNILYEDSNVLTVEKPAGLLSVPGKTENLSDCLLSRVQVAFPDALLVHRLDRDTSGVMVFGMTAHAQRHLSMQFEKRLVKKTYVARVSGRVAEKSGKIDLPLIVDWSNRPLQKVCYETGRSAFTEWVRLKVGYGESRLRLMPKSGRSHQLRVHCLAIGHPILGDPLYAPEIADGYPRMMLHAEELRLNHPESSKGMKFRIKAPF